VQAVAARATELARTVDKADRDLLVAAAWVHDIGYAPPLAVTGFHPLDGARHLDRSGFLARLAALVAHHSGRPLRGRRARTPE
jgi:HD superfamily phosphodiesterase